MDIDRYRHNYEGFYEQKLIPNVYKEGENDHNSRFSYEHCDNSLLSSLSLLVKSFEEEIQPSKDLVDIIRD